MSHPPSVSERSSTRGPRPTLAQVLLVVAGVLLLPVALTVMFSIRGVKNWDAIGTLAGKMTVWYLGMFVIASIVYSRTRHKSLWPAAITLVALMLTYSTLMFGGLAIAQARAGAAVRWRDIDALNERMISEIRANVEAGAIANFEEVVARYTGGMEQIGAGLTGDSAIALQIGMGFARDMATLTKNYLGSLQPFLAAGALRSETLPDKAAVVKRRRVLQPAISFHAATLASLEKIPEDLRGRAARLGLESDKAAKVSEGMLRGMSYARLLKVHRLERDMIALMDAHLADLERLAPEWHVSNGQFIFTDIGEKSLAAFNARVEKLQALAEEQETVQAEWQARRRGP